MSTERIRQAFESKNPLPEGVSWDGDHYDGNQLVMGSHRNASIWNDMLRGYLQGWADAALGALK